MRRPRAPGLRARLVLALFVTAAATLVVAALALLPPLESRLSTDTARTLVLRAEAARPNFERLHPDQLTDPPRQHLHRLLRAVGRASSAQAVLVSPSGVVADTDPDAPGGFDDANYVLRTQHTTWTIRGDEARAAVPVAIDGQLYALALRRRLEDVVRTVRVVEKAFAGAALAGLALALIGGVLLSGRMLRRLRILNNAVQSAEPGEPHVPDLRRDELGELSRAFSGLQARLARQEDARRTFVSTASHELRTPLASLQSLLELVADEVDGDDPDLAAVRADVREALAQARRLGGLSSGLLDLSRLDAGTETRSEPVELGELTRAVTAEFRARPSAGDGRPSWIAPEEPCWALGDPDGVARIVRLLVDNALRHAPAPAPVQVRTERRGDLAVVRVLDGGAGIRDDERKAIFERFRRGEASTTPGFGLGLAIGSELARRMGGELALETEPAVDGEPGGARFALALPAAPAESVAVPDLHTSATSAA